MRPAMTITQKLSATGSATSKTKAGKTKAGKTKAGKTKAGETETGKTKIGKTKARFAALHLAALGTILLALQAAPLFSQTSPAPSPCVQSPATGWANQPLALQTAPFTATFDATPSQASTDGVIGFSLGAASDYTSLAAIARFNSAGLIDARNGANYSADIAAPYFAGMSYHFRLTIDPTKHLYSVYVTAPGGSEVALASNYAFRAEEAALSSFNNWGLNDDQGSLSVCNMTITATPAQPAAGACTTTAATGTWTNTSVALQTASFSAAYDATPGQSPMDGSVGFSGSAASSYASLAIIARFNPSGFIDARNGANYAADVSIPYLAGVSYHFRLTINPATRIYSVYVTPPGQAEMALASNYAFRSEQATLTSIGNWAAEADAGSLSVCNMALAAVDPPASSILPPAITTQPSSQTIMAGQTATFTVAATGTAPLTYQWRENGMAISGAISSTYTTPATTPAESGATFTVIVGNPAGTATSVSATLTISSACQQTSGTGWTNSSLSTQTAPFTATFDTTPSQLAMDGAIGFSLNPATDYTSLATIVRFNPSGFIDVRNGGIYTADLSVPYVAGVSYHFRMAIDPTTQHYSVYVTPAGATELALASGYAFRAEQATLTSINNWGMDAATGAVSVCNIGLAPLAGGVAAPPAVISLSPTPSSLSLGSVNVGASSSAVVTLSNSGNAAASISNVSVSGAGINVSGLSTGQVIAAGQSAAATVAFAPVAAGSMTGSVTIASNAANSPATISITGMGTQAAVQHSATLSWTPSGTTSVGYNVYRGTVSGGPFTKLNSAEIQATTNTDTTVQAGNTYYYVVTALDASGEESGYSNQATAVIP
jgi:hypothetical protein